VPDGEVMEQHARRLIEQQLTTKALAELRDDIARQAADAALPEDLEDEVEILLMQRPELSWDQALREILNP
jgi:predicted metal-dependent peptidase